MGQFPHGFAPSSATTWSVITLGRCFLMPSPSSPWVPVPITATTATPGRPCTARPSLHLSFTSTPWSFLLPHLVHPSYASPTWFACQFPQIRGRTPEYTVSVLP